MSRKKSKLMSEGYPHSKHGVLHRWDCGCHACKIHRANRNNARLMDKAKQW